MNRLSQAWGVFLFLLLLNTTAAAQSFSGTTGLQPETPAEKTSAPVQEPRPSIPQHLQQYFGPDGKMVLPPGQQVQQQGMPWEMPHLQQKPQAPQKPQPPAQGQSQGQGQGQQAVSPTGQADSCAAYQQNPRNYAICRDRVLRLERMKDAQKRRSQAIEDQKKQREEQRRQAEEKRKEQQERSRRVRRPGEVTPPARQPLPVEIIQAPVQE